MDDGHHPHFAKVYIKILNPMNSHRITCYFVNLKYSGTIKHVLLMLSQNNRQTYRGRIFSKWYLEKRYTYYNGRIRTDISFV